MDKQMIEEMARIIAFDLCPNRHVHAKWGEEAQCYSDNNFAECTKIKNVVDKLYNAGYRKIPEGAVVLTREEYEKLKVEQDEVISCVKVAHIAHFDGEKYVSFDDYEEYTDRLGKKIRQQKARIEDLEKLLDDRCDRCIERERKETAEKFAEKARAKAIKARVNIDDHPRNDSFIFLSDIDEICNEITGGANRNEIV